MTRRRMFLPVLILLAGLLVPVVPRIVVPLVAPADYVDDLPRILEQSGVLLYFGWTAMPFAVLAVVTFVRQAAVSDEASRRHVDAGAVGALVPALAMGWMVHVPSAIPGMNFGIPAFPFYCIVLMPVGWAAGSWLAGRLAVAGR